MSASWESLRKSANEMGAFLLPTSSGLMVAALILAVCLTGATTLCWDRGHGWTAVRFIGPPVSFLLLATALLIAVNLQDSLFQTWIEVWSYLP